MISEVELLLPAARRIGRDPCAARDKHSHQKRAALGVWAVNRGEADRARIAAWKGATPFGLTEARRLARALADLVLEWSPVFSAGTVVTVPPQGASAPGPYAA